MIWIIASFFSGIITGLAFNLSSLSFLVWFSLLPFIAALYSRENRDNRWCGFLFGLGFYGLTVFWLWNVTFLGFLLLLLYLSLYPLAFFIIGRSLVRRTLPFISLPALWVGLEFIKEHFLSGFGWAHLAHSQFANLYLVQIADITGAKGVSFLIVMVNVLIWEVSSSRDASPRRQDAVMRRTIFAASLVLFCLGYSFIRVASLKPQKYTSVSILQPNIPQSIKWKEYSQITIADELAKLAAQTGEKPLLIFPESSWPQVTDDANYPKLEAFIKKMKRDVLIGVVRQEKDKYYNAAMLFDSDGKLRNVYRKIRLVPFGEYVPGRKFLRFISVVNEIGDMSPGKEITKFWHGGNNFSVLVCFEDIFPGLVSRFAEDKDFLVNITNDAWFWGEPQASQHLAIMTFRAIENRISIVRAANTGISGWVSFRGDIQTFQKDGREVFVSGTGVFPVDLRKSGSLYQRYGEVFTYLCLIWLAIAALLPRKEGDLDKPKKYAPRPQKTKDDKDLDYEGGA